MFSFGPTDRICIRPERRAVDVCIRKSSTVADRNGQLEVYGSAGNPRLSTASELWNDAKLVYFGNQAPCFFTVLGIIKRRSDLRSSDTISKARFIHGR